MSTPANQLGIPPPTIDTSQYPSYLDAQRKAQLAQMLMGAFQQSVNSPNPTTGVSGAAGTVTPRRGIMQSVAPLVEALMAGKAQNTANQSTQQYMQGLYNPQQPATPTGPGSGIVSPDAPPAAQEAAQAVSASTPRGLVAPAATAQPAARQSNPMIPPGMTPSSAQQMLNLMGPEKYASTFIAPQYQQPEILAKLRAAGITAPADQQNYIRQSLQKENYIAPTAVRANETELDPLTHQPFFTGPDAGVNQTWDAQGNPTQSVIPGAAQAAQALAKAKTIGAQTAMPIKLGTDQDGKDIYGYAQAPGSGIPNATAPGKTASPADIAAQKKGAEAGVDYGSNLAAQAKGATDLRRGLSELTNLSQQANPGAANQGKVQAGAALIAMGADPDWVSKATGVDIGALQAAEHTSGGIAVAGIHQMTNRGTNFDMATFQKMNPSLNMADPAAFKRVTDYMNKQAQDTIAQQKEFSQWVPQARASGVSPQDYETQFTAHWLDKQNQAIDKGATNSAPPLTRLQQLQAEAQRRGLKVPAQ